MFILAHLKSIQVQLDDINVVHAISSDLFVFFPNTKNTLSENVIEV